MSADVDIDFANRNEALKFLKHIKASRNVKLENNKLEIDQHNTGVYMQDIPHDPVSMQSTIDYKSADARGYFKIDFLNASVYNDVKSEEHLIELMNREPIWDLLLNAEFSDMVFHLHGHSALLQKLKPRTVEQLAATLAIIRPAKRHLADKSWIQILEEVWIKPTDDSYYFKKAHAISYAVAVIVHMNVLCEQITASES